MKKIITTIAFIFVITNSSFAQADIYWPDELYKDGEPDYADGDLEDKLGDSGYYYDLFPEERDGEPDDNVSKNKKTDVNNPVTIYQNNISGWYNDPNSLRNYENTYQITVIDANGNVIGNNNVENEKESANTSNGNFNVINGNIYYIKSDGSFKTQWLQINDDWYYFDKETYVMLHDVAKNINDRLYYFEADGRMAKNANKIINGIYYTIGADGVCKY